MTTRHLRTIQVEPMGKPRMTQRDKWQQRPAVMKYRTYCDELRLRLPLYDLPAQLHITFYLPMPKSWSKKRRTETAGRPHDQKPDIDNLAKGFMDAFHTEDKHVYSLTAEKYWSEYGAVVVAEPWEERGAA
jgi:Holliday junction resolvase RusA-like endonuclease